MSVRIGCPSAFTPARIRKPSRNPGPRNASTLVRFALSKLALKMNFPTASLMPRAIRCTCSSLSITQGPATSTSGLPAPKAAKSKSLVAGQQRLLFGRQALHVIFIRRADERFEQRVRLHRLRLELRVELAAEEPRMSRDLADLDIGPV